MDFAEFCDALARYCREGDKCLLQCKPSFRFCVMGCENVTGVDWYKEITDMESEMSILQQIYLDAQKHADFKKGDHVIITEEPDDKEWGCLAGDFERDVYDKLKDFTLVVGTKSLLGGIIVQPITSTQNLGNRYRVPYTVLARVTNENYIKTADFHVGDRVILTRILFCDEENRWSILWPDRVLSQIGCVGTVLEVDRDSVKVDFGDYEHCYLPPFVLKKVASAPEPAKADPDFKPFTKVLVRDSSDEYWRPKLYSRKVLLNGIDGMVYYDLSDCYWKQCIPYEGNEELAFTTKEPK